MMRLSYKGKKDDFRVIRGTIEDIYLNLKEVPTYKILLGAIKIKKDVSLKVL